MKSLDQTELKHTLQSIFPTLNEETLNSIIPFCEFKQVRKHAEVHSEGKPHPYSYMILKGAAKAYYFKEAKEVCIWFAFEGEFIGSMATFQGLPSLETVVLLEDSDLIQIQIKELRELAQRDLSMCRLVNEL
ncbi:MAG: cyclic nucleotide-binding domain-containing protein, partial [Bacteroidota bacterium]